MVLKKLAKKRWLCAFNAIPSVDTRIDISKAFDKVWHTEGSLLKLNYKLFIQLKTKKSHSDWSIINAGVPQVLGLLYFFWSTSITYQMDCWMLADDTSLFAAMHDNISDSNILCNDLYKWAYPDPTKTSWRSLFPLGLNFPSISSYVSYIKIFM